MPAKAAVLQVSQFKLSVARDDAPGSDETPHP